MKKEKANPIKVKYKEWIEGDVESKRDLCLFSW